MNLIVKGREIVSSDEGEGPAILMLHGWMSDLRTFDDMAKALSKKYRVVRPNAPGFGGSALPAEDWSVPEYAEFVADYLKKLKIDHPHAIITHSMGARFVVYGLAHSLFETDKYIMLAGSGIPASSSSKIQAYRAIAKAGKTAATILPGSIRGKLRKKLYKSAGSSDYLNAGALKQVFSNMINEDATKYADKVDVETLLIYGNEDAETPLDYGETYNRLIPSSRLEVIEGASHYVHLQEADKVLKLIKDFIK